jgi:predicted nucleic acid-binding protein
MPLDLPDGGKCFVDANIFYYHLVDTPPLSDPCTTFLERAANGTIEVYTSLPILADAVHKVLLTEAAMKFGQNRAGLVNWLQRTSAPDIRALWFPASRRQSRQYGFGSLTG